MRKKSFILLALVSFLFLTPPEVYAFSNTDPEFQHAQQLYFHENYEEALDAFKSLKAKYPDSSEVVFYLGMAYKRMQDYRSAQPLLEEACSLQPRFEGAVPELIEILYQNDMPDKAYDWICVAEQEFIAPAQTAFLKGLVLLKKGDAPSAIKAFDDAQALEPSLAQSVAYQKAAALSQKKDYKRAREELRGVVIKDPTSDLAAFASEYIDALSRQQEADRTIKGSVSCAMQYDDNVIFVPTDPSLVTDASNQEDWLYVGTAQAEWAIKPAKMNEPGLNAVYSFYGTKHNDIGLYDTQSHDISLQPAYYSQSATFALPLHYNYVTLNDDPYLDTAGISSLVNLSDAYNRMWQIQVQYNRNDYHWAVSNSHENKDSDDSAFSVSRYWFGDSSGYLNMQYVFNYSEAAGRNWEYAGNRLIMTLVVPVRKTLQWNFVADLNRQNFVYMHSTYDKKRKDDIVTVSNLLVKDITENVQFQAQHTYVYDKSNIGVYKYKKNTYSLGAKYRF